MNPVMAAISSLTLPNLPRRMAWRVVIEEKTWTRFSHDPEVGVQCSVIHEVRASHAVSADVPEQTCWAEQRGSTLSGSPPRPGAARAANLLLDGFTVRFTDGHACGCPKLVHGP